MIRVTDIVRQGMRGIVRPVVFSRVAQSFRRSIVALAATAIALTPALSAQALELNRWRYDEETGKLEFSLDGKVMPQAQLIFNPTRIVIDLPGAEIRDRVRESHGGAVRLLRIAQFDDETVRIVVELSPDYKIEPERLKVRGVTSLDWVLEIPKR